MRLRDDRFLTPPQAEKQTWTREALAGVGDRMKRETDDFVMSFGSEPATPRAAKLEAGEAVEFSTPDGITRSGALVRKQGEADWLVEVDHGTYNVVPSSELRPTAKAPKAEQRRRMREAMVGERLHEPRAPIDLNTTDFKVTLEYGAHNRVPSNDEVVAYVRTKYAARVIDANTTQPGKLSVVCTREQVKPSDPTSTDQPGLETEMMEGTGRVAFVIESLKRIAKLNPNYDFVPGTVVESDDGVEAGFELRSNNGMRMYVSARGGISPVIADDVSPAVGRLSYDGDRLTGAMFDTAGEAVALSAFGIKAHAGVEPPYSSGTGPQSTRENEPGSYESGNYVVRAEDKDAAGYTDWVRPDQYARDYERAHGKAPTQPGPSPDDLAKQRMQQRRREMQQQQLSGPPQDWMTASAEEESETIAGPGDVVAVDQNAKKYWQEYYGNGYGAQMTKDNPKPKKRGEMEQAIRAAWLLGQDREPSEDEVLRAIAALCSVKTAVAHASEFQRLAASTSMNLRDVAMNLLNKAGSDTDARKKINSALIGFLGRNPGMLDQLDQTVYARILAGALNDSQSQRPLLGMMGDMYEKGQSKTYLPNVGIGNPKPRGQTEVSGPPSGMQDAPSAPAAQEASGTAPQQVGGSGGQTVGPAKPGLWERTKQLVERVGPGGSGRVEKMTQQVEQQSQQEQDESKRLEWEKQNPLKQRITRGVLNKDAAAPKGQQPAMGDKDAMRPIIQRMSAQGSYLCIDIVWDADTTKEMSAGNIRHNVISHIKRMAAQKEYIDLGTIGKPRFKVFDPDAGMARVLVRSSNAKAFPQEVTEVDGKDNDPSA